MQCAGASVFTFCPFTAPTGQTKGTAGPKLAGHTYTTAICVLFGLPFLWGAGCARQDRKTLFERGLPVLENCKLATPILVH